MTLAEDAPAAADNIKWFASPSDPFEMDGLYWFKETPPEVCHLPDRMKGRVRDAVWEESLAPAGARIRFASDTTALRVRVRYSGISANRFHLSVVGTMALDLFVDGRHVNDLGFERMAARLAPVLAPILGLGR